MDDSDRRRWIVPGGSTILPTTPGLHGLEPSALPSQLQRIPGVSSYYASVHSAPMLLPNGVRLGGDLLVARSADGMTKHYLYGFGTNSAGQPVIAGPHKDFEGHHVSSGQTFAVNSMFAQSPFRKSN